MRYLSYIDHPLYTPHVNRPPRYEQVSQLFAALPSLVWSENAFPLDLYQDGETFVVRAELPGFAKNELTLESADGVLTVAARQPSETGKEPDRQFSREVRLPEFADSGRIEAVFEQGVLTVRIPKREEARSVKINVS